MIIFKKIENSLDSKLIEFVFDYFFKNFDNFKRNAINLFMS